MKHFTLIIALAIITSCGNSTDKVDDENLEVTSETSKSIKEAQDINSELEEIDGELDSLLIKIN